MQQPIVNYFCYGSNMLLKRMHVNNKSAKRLANGILRNYKLAFSGDSVTWKGGTANIVPTDGASVLGVVYTLHASDIDSLDKQEVGYDAIEVQVEVGPSPDIQTISCRTYIQKDSFKNELHHNNPSKLYKEVVIKGAHEHGICDEYISELKLIPDNGVTDCGPPNFTL